MTKDIVRKVLADYPHINEIDTWGETAFFYNPNNKPRGTYFCAVKYGNWFNYAGNKKKFIDTYGRIERGTNDFTHMGRIRPHEHYAWIQWMTIEDPTEEEVKQALADAWERIYK